MRVNQRGTVLFGCAGGLLVVAGGLAAAYYAVATRSEARAATIKAMTPPVHEAKVATGGKALTALLAKQIDIKTGLGIKKARAKWSASISSCLSPALTSACISRCPSSCARSKRAAAAHLPLETRTNGLCACQNENDVTSSNTSSMC